MYKEGKKNKFGFIVSDGDIALAPIRADDEAIIQYTKWVNDREIARFIGGAVKIRSFEKEKEWALKASKEQSCDKLSFNIVVLNDDALIGNCELRRLNIYGSWELGILIGEEDYLGKKYGRKVIGMLLKLAFDDLGARRVRLTANSENERALRCYKACGFEICGVEHETECFGGKWSNTIYMEIMASKYSKMGIK